MIDIAMRGLAKAKRWRKTLLTIAFLIFIAGTAWSMNSLGVDKQKFEFLPFIIVLVILVPLTISYSAVNMILMGRVIDVPVNFRLGAKVSAFAQVAEILPIPAGPIVRVSALVKQGAKASRGTAVVIAFSLLWVCLAAIGGGIVLLESGLLGLVLMVVGGLGTCAIFYWVKIKAGLVLATVSVGIRILGILLVTARIVLSFAAIGFAIEPTKGFVMTFAIILGSATSIFPSGLGIGEALASLFSGPVDINPAAAFLAVALNRILGIIGHFILAAYFIKHDKSDINENV